MWASLHNTTKTHLAVVGRFAFVLCGACHVCLSYAGELCLSTPPYPSHSTREAGRAAPADPAPSHPAQSSLGPPLTHIPVTTHVFDFRFPVPHARSSSFPYLTTSLVRRFASVLCGAWHLCLFGDANPRTDLTLIRTQPAMRAGRLQPTPRSLAPCSKPTWPSTATYSTQLTLSYLDSLSPLSPLLFSHTLFIPPVLFDSQRFTQPTY